MIVSAFHNFHAHKKTMHSHAHFVSISGSLYNVNSFLTLPCFLLYGTHPFIPCNNICRNLNFRDNKAFLRKKNPPPEIFPDGRHPVCCNCLCLIVYPAVTAHSLFVLFVLIRFRFFQPIFFKVFFKLGFFIKIFDFVVKILIGIIFL